MYRLTPALVREWHARTALHTPTTRAHAYALLKTICATAVTDDLITANPCRIRDAGQAKRASKTEPASLEDLEALVDAMPEKYRLMVLLAAWCGLRFGELTELRGKDIDTRKGVIKIRRAVTWVDSKPVVGTPKTDAGVRDVAVPPHLMPAVREHLIAGTRDSSAVPLAARNPPHDLDAVRLVLARPWNRRPPGPPIPRPSSHRRRPRRRHRRHPRRTHEPPRTLHTRRRHALPTRSQGARRADRATSV